MIHSESNRESPKDSNQPPHGPLVVAPLVPARTRVRPDLALTFGAQQRGRTLQEVSDLLQRPSLLPAVDAALGVVASGRGGGALRGGDAVALRGGVSRFRCVEFLLVKAPW